jgi:hypothetical protein
MKKRTGVILAVVAFIVGMWTGHFVSSYFWSRFYGEGTITHCLYDVSSAYFPLKLLKDGQTERAAQYLQMQLHGALTGVDLTSTTLHRPDMLTNSAVVSARAFDKN